ncbi:MAG: recombinase family protein [Ruminococcus sp.]|nr:recombinase family protein [Ruminococcus sp.]
MAKIAIYARKSVFREDSISIESQIELCEYEARGEDYLIYKDNGFSGKNTDRPDFQRMINDIKAGIINKVIVYKLDRVSRSVLDFSEMMELFQNYHVYFVSATEHFDTASPMGRAMLNICIVFAQLERETIQQRVIDAYASRSKKGFYMGGKIPYGYKKVPITIDGVKTSMYEHEPDEAADIKLIYQLYSNPSATLGDVLRELKDRGLNINRRGRYWNTARLSETMRNPAYTFADVNMYHFFKEQKSNIVNPPEEFNGVTSMYLFSGENTNRKTWDLSGQNIVIAPHQGIVDTDTWIACRRKLLANHQVRTCKPKNSFLSGKIKCGNCGYGLVVRFSDRKRKNPVRYFIDTGWTDNKCCTHKLPTIHADEFEEMIVSKITDKTNSLGIKSKKEQNTEIQDKINKL